MRALKKTRENVMRISGGKALQTEGSASAKAQRKSLTCIFKRIPHRWSRVSKQQEKEREETDVGREVKLYVVL